MAKTQTTKRGTVKRKKRVVDDVIETPDGEIIEEIVSEVEEEEFEIFEEVEENEAAAGCVDGSVTDAVASDEMVVGVSPAMAAASTFTAIGQGLALSAHNAAALQASSQNILHASTVDAVAQILSGTSEATGARTILDQRLEPLAEILGEKKR